MSTPPDATTAAVFEIDVIDRLGEHLQPLGTRRVLLVCSPSRRAVDRAVRAMSELHVEVFDGARVHVPATTVEACLAAVDAARADTVVALGGGAAVGLGKAVCLARQLSFVAVPTTYSGSEMTSLYGITQGREKRTGRDERVRPRLVLYDASLTTGVPVALTVQSLGNSLAQIVSALSTDSVADPVALYPTVGAIWHLAKALGERPTDLQLRERALRASSRAGSVVDAGKMGPQHALAHAIGGRFDLPHSAVHSVLLPAFMAWLRRQRPELLEQLDAAAGVAPLEAHLRALLQTCSAPVTLRELGIDRGELEKLLQARPELPAEIAWAAFDGRSATVE